MVDWGGSRRRGRKIEHGLDCEERWRDLDLDAVRLRDVDLDGVRRVDEDRWRDLDRLGVRLLDINLDVVRRVDEDWLREPAWETGAGN